MNDKLRKTPERQAFKKKKIILEILNLKDF